MYLTTPPTTSPKKKHTHLDPLDVDDVNLPHWNIEMLGPPRKKKLVPLVLKKRNYYPIHLPIIPRINPLLVIHGTATRQLLVRAWPNLLSALTVRGPCVYEWWVILFTILYNTVECRTLLICLSLLYITLKLLPTVPLTFMLFLPRKVIKSTLCV